MPEELVVHMVGNAHLDPVWLWHWQRGSDEALATCRAACDLLDDYPDARFTRGEVWSYKQVLDLDPDLFKRIRAHVEAGRWEVVNGWWVQTDMNLPTEAAMLKTLQMGHAWLRKNLGVSEVPVGYSVDAFGHGAFIPRILSQAGQKYYVFMRPHVHERPLPSNLFRWKSPDGHSLLACRIASYLWEASNLEIPIRRALDMADRQTGHVLCLYGVGDHGGGPTRQAVEWIRDHAAFEPGIRLEFSTCTRFFTEVANSRPHPEFVGELHPHAIGCYTVCGPLKRDIRKAELAATDAQRLLASTGPERDDARRAVDDAWERICFNQFHDIFPGSSIRSAIDVAAQDLAAADNIVQRAIHPVLRTDPRFSAGCSLTGHRVNLVNRAPDLWKGLAECEIWFDWRPWQHHLEDQSGRVVPSQQIDSASLIPEWWATPIPRLLFPVELAPLAYKALKIVNDPAPQPKNQLPCSFRDGRLDNGLLQVGFGPEGVVSIVSVSNGRQLLAEPLKLLCRQDLSDTWGHNVYRFEGPVLATAQFGPPVPLENGPLRAMVRLDGRVGDSYVMLFVSLHRDEPVLYLTLQTNYQERMSVLKASLTPVGGISARQDRVAGGWITRALDGKEYPLHHAIALKSPTGPLGLVLPESFALDCSDASVNVTLIRNNLNALHNSGNVPLKDLPRQIEFFGTDEGPQIHRLALVLGSTANPDGLESVLTTLQRPLHVWDDFRDTTRLDHIGHGIIPNF